jgi:hypothetical protein
MALSLRVVAGCPREKGRREVLYVLTPFLAPFILAPFSAAASKAGAAASPAPGAATAPTSTGAATTGPGSPTVFVSSLSGLDRVTG